MKIGKNHVRRILSCQILGIQFVKFQIRPKNYHSKFSVMAMVDSFSVYIVLCRFR